MQGVELQVRCHHAFSHALTTLSLDAEAAVLQSSIVILRLCRQAHSRAHAEMHSFALMQTKPRPLGIGSHLPPA